RCGCRHPAVWEWPARSRVTAECRGREARRHTTKGLCVRKTSSNVSRTVSWLLQATTAADGVRFKAAISVNGLQVDLRTKCRRPEAVIQSMPSAPTNSIKV